MLRRTSLSIAVCASALAAAGGGAHAAQPSGDALWSVSARGALSAKQLGLGPRASDASLARAAVQRKRSRLAGGHEIGRIGFAGRLPAPGATRGSSVRFQQRLGGLRVLWSQLHVSVARGVVQDITGTLVPLPEGGLSGKLSLSREQARATAAAQGGSAGLTQLVAYAGEPGASRPARRAYVVEVAMPLVEGEDSDVPLCVVVDAEDGTVLKTWRGSLARPRNRSAERSLAATPAGATVLGQFVDSQGSGNLIQNDIVRPYLDRWTTGSPFSFASNGVTSVNGQSSVTTAITAARALAAGRHFCLARKFCGRDGGYDGSVNRYFFNTNWGGSSVGLYRSDEERIYIRASHAQSGQTIAHEIGHRIDHAWRDDFLQSFEADEVEEALAEMFAYDYARESTFEAAPGENVISRLLREPNRFTIAGATLPDHYSEYNCTTDDEHVNGYILAHAYSEFVERVGHETAGNILIHIPWRLTARRTFGDVRDAFRSVIVNSHGTSSAVFSAYIQAFGTETGILFKHNREDTC